MMGAILIPCMWKTVQSPENILVFSLFYRPPIWQGYDLRQCQQIYPERFFCSAVSPDVRFRSYISSAVSSTCDLFCLDFCRIRKDRYLYRIKPRKQTSFLSVVHIKQSILLCVVELKCHIRIKFIHVLCFQ